MNKKLESKLEALIRETNSNFKKNSDLSSLEEVTCEFQEKRIRAQLNQIENSMHMIYDNRLRLEDRLISEFLPDSVHLDSLPRSRRELNNLIDKLQSEEFELLKDAWVKTIDFALK